MKKTICSLIIIVCTIICHSAFAGEIRQLTWDDLIPAHLRSEDPIGKLPEDKQDLAFWVINMLETLPERGPDTEELYEQVDKAIPELKEAGIDIAKILEEREEIETAMVEELNGKQVRIPGYLLPLEISDFAVTEFLLVPYFGACIHVPPPPPNQIVFVKVVQGEGYIIKKLFEPVWVAGVLSVKSTVKDLFLVDGSADIDIGYSMQANRIEPFKTKNN